MPCTFVCLYHGPTLETASVVGISTDTTLVRAAADALMREPRYTSNEQSDSASRALNTGRRRALRAIVRQTSAQEARP